MDKKLRALHRGISRIRGFRTTARVGSALAMFASIVLWMLLAAFILDVAMHMGLLERAIVLLLMIGVAVWAFGRYMAPAFGSHEDDMQLALMVERQQGISSDLVAALQFADGRRAQFGSDQLRAAVIDYTDEVSGHLNYLEGFDRKEMSQRCFTFFVTLIIAAVPCLAFPGHAQAFLSRFMLADVQYPTRTQIVEIASPAPRTAYGQPVVFKVRAGGEIPEQGRAELSALTSGLRTTVDLTPDPDDPTLFTGKLARVLDDLTYTVYLGDAYSRPQQLELIPLPVVEVRLEIETPAYAADRFQAEGEAGRRRVALEGSRVKPVITSDKPLKSATLALDGNPFALRQAGDHWTLASSNTPLARVEGPLRYEVQVVDEDGLSLERPISGMLQVRADQPPRIAAATVTSYVLPGAAPRIKFRAVDDYALDRVEVHKSIVKQGVADETLSDSQTQSEKTVTVVAKPADHPAEFEQTVAVTMGDLDLMKGDRVVVHFEAFDHRGDLPGKSSRSEQMVFQVTDRAGVLAALRELDTQMDEKLDQIIKAQLGRGE